MGGGWNGDCWASCSSSSLIVSGTSGRFPEAAMIFPNQFISRDKFIYKITGLDVYIHQMLFIGTQGHGPVPTWVFCPHCSCVLLCTGALWRCSTPNAFQCLGPKEQQQGKTPISGVLFLGHAIFLAESLHNVKLNSVIATQWITKE